MKNTTSTEKKPRTIDPTIAELRKEHAAKVVALKESKASASIFSRIITMLPKLSSADSKRLADILGEKHC